MTVEVLWCPISSMIWWPMGTLASPELPSESGFWGADFTFGVGPVLELGCW